MINENGGKMPDAVGIPEEQLRHAAELSVCKINIDSDLRLAMTGTIRQFFNEHPDKFDPREYLKPARANIKELVRHKLRRRPRLRRQGLIAEIRDLLCRRAEEIFYGFSVSASGRRTVKMRSGCASRPPAASQPA